jgi:uncharacterized membrane protein (Fun14 family)
MRAIRKILRTLLAIIGIDLFVVILLNQKAVGDALTKGADAVVNFVAETHVYRST